MNGRPRAVRGAQAWALGASACGHRHGRRQLLASPQREPHLDVARWLQLPMARILKGKGAHSAIGGGGVESSGARRSASRRTAVTVVETPGARNTSSFPPSSMNHVLSVVGYHPLCVDWATRDRESGGWSCIAAVVGAWRAVNRSRVLPRCLEGFDYCTQEVSEERNGEGRLRMVGDSVGTGK